MKFKELKAIWQKRLEDKDLYNHASYSCFYINDKQEYKDADICMLLSDILKILPSFNSYQGAEKYVRVCSISDIPTAKISAFEDLDVYIMTDYRATYFIGKCIICDRIEERDCMPIEKFEIKTLIVKEQDFNEEHGVVPMRPSISVLYKDNTSDALRRYRFEVDATQNQFLIAGIAFGDIIVYPDGKMGVNKIKLSSARYFEPRFSSANDAVFYKAAVLDAIDTGLIEVRTYNEK